MEDFEITTDMVKGQVKKIKNWTAPGNDEVHGCWLKHLTSQHTRIAKELNFLFQTGIKLIVELIVDCKWS